jgi:hypothetical protein
MKIAQSWFRGVGGVSCAKLLVLERISDGERTIRTVDGAKSGAHLIGFVAHDHHGTGGSEWGDRAQNVLGKRQSSQTVQHLRLLRRHPFTEACRKHNYRKRLALAVHSRWASFK